MCGCEHVRFSCDSAKDSIISSVRGVSLSIVPVYRSKNPFVRIALVRLALRHMCNVPQRSRPILHAEQLLLDTSWPLLRGAETLSDWLPPFAGQASCIHCFFPPRIQSLLCVIVPVPCVVWVQAQMSTSLFRIFKISMLPCSVPNASSARRPKPSLFPRLHFPAGFLMSMRCLHHWGCCLGSRTCLELTFMDLNFG